ncbi:MAG: MoaD/ThiS family protein [Deltaproteobacteria bacterium]|nr:MoaD/ThiS family protein [Deltaproteobacteria bacterium]
MIVTVRLYEELNDVLPVEQRKRAFSHELPEDSTVSALLNSLRIPVERVELALVNGRSVNPSCLLQDNDYVSLFPVFESIDIGPLVRFRSFPLRSPKFLTDRTADALGEKLRQKGYDVHQEANMDDAELAEVADREGRILLSVRIGLGPSAGVARALSVPDGDPEVQLAHLLDRLSLG